MLKKVINYSFLSYFPGQTSAIKKNLLDLSVGKTHVQLRQKSDSRENKMRLPVGYDDFRAVIENNLTFVDKSMFVKDIIDDSSQVILITRPRRFGKTINMSLLNYFFAEQILQRKTQGLFDSLKIANEPKYMSLQGKYPVVSLTLKDVKGAKHD